MGRNGESGQVFHILNVRRKKRLKYKIITVGKGNVTGVTSFLCARRARKAHRKRKY